MGAPKQRWTSEEEAALKAGIHKYGLGKWSTILKDEEFSAALRLRSNVDLKDKWRNLNCMVNGTGSRNRSRFLHKTSHSIKQDVDGAVDAMMVEKDSKVVDVMPVSESNGTSLVVSETPSFRMEDLILEAVTKLKEPRGSSQHAIARYIEEHQSSLPNLEKSISTSLKLLTENGRLMKVRRQYRITPKTAYFEGKEQHPPMMLLCEATKDLPEVQKNGVIVFSKSEIDAELEKMKSMTAKEAAAAAAQAVAEAEAAIAEAEVAAREAEVAEAEAEAARCFVAVAMKNLSCRTIQV